MLIRPRLLPSGWRHPDGRSAWFRCSLHPDCRIDAAEISPDALPVLIVSITKPRDDWPRGLHRLAIHPEERLAHTERFVIR